MTRAEIERQRALSEFSLRVAAATGHCDACGGQVIE